MSNAEYTLERCTAEIDAESYIRRYRDTERFIACCRQCGNYGRRWTCPPFDGDPLDALGDFDTVRLIGVKVAFHDKSLRIVDSPTLLRPILATLNEELLVEERTLGGRCFGFVGTCPYCTDIPCARTEGKPCRHPDTLRPSLEAVGFNLDATARDLLGLEIIWGKDGLLPDYLTLVCGIFYRRSR